MATDATAESTETQTDAQAELEELRGQIDRMDSELIRLWKERAAVSQRIGQIRMANGGTRLVLNRERAILDKYGTALGADGTNIAMLILRAGRGPL
ncbi:chorismate mutase [Salininema proteolyticum]|uniref:Chorismate mutase n=1 Tax=Salininema proteolyticum TaxID=1607685 RepID=A0ABV8U4K0_9ACTN